MVAGSRCWSSFELDTLSTGAVPGTGGLRGGVASEPDAMLADGADFTDAADAVFSGSMGELDMRTSGGLWERRGGATRFRPVGGRGGSRRVVKATWKSVALGGVVSSLADCG